MQQKKLKFVLNVTKNPIMVKNIFRFALRRKNTGETRTVHDKAFKASLINQAKALNVE